MKRQEYPDELQRVTKFGDDDAERVTAALDDRDERRLLVLKVRAAAVKEKDAVDFMAVASHRLLQKQREVCKLRDEIRKQREANTQVQAEVDDQIRTICDLQDQLWARAEVDDQMQTLTELQDQILARRGKPTAELNTSSTNTHNSPGFVHLGRRACNINDKGNDTGNGKDNGKVIGNTNYNKSNKHNQNRGAIPTVWPLPPTNIASNYGPSCAVNRSEVQVVKVASPFTPKRSPRMTFPSSSTWKPPPQVSY